MPTLVLKTFKAEPAQGPDGSPRTHLSRLEVPHPDKSVEISSATEAQSAFDTYIDEVKQTGKPAHVFGDLKKGDRAPRGFKALKLDRYVNV